MEVHLENTASATANNDPAHCFLAIELSKSSWVLGFQTPLAKQTSRYQVKACDAKALLELIERVRSRVARELGRPVEVMSCYEAGYDGFWLQRVEAHGIHNHVLDPASLQVNRRARRPKTDRIDANRMVRALIRHLITARYPVTLHIIHCGQLSMAPSGRVTSTATRSQDSCGPPNC
jgi:transposase